MRPDVSIVGSGVRLTLITVALLGLAAACGGGGGGAPPGPDEPVPQWQRLDVSAPPGSPCEVTLDGPACSEDETVFDVEIPGFYTLEKMGPDGRKYQQVFIPGMGTHNQPGAPDLPLVRLHMAVPTMAKNAEITEIIPQDVQVFDNILVWPQAIPERDHEEGDPEEFQINQAIYDLSTDWPTTDGDMSVPIRRELRSIPTASFLSYPIKWNPTTRQLKIPRSVRYKFRHNGDVPQYEAITPERERMAASRFYNWSEMREHFEVNWVLYTADYLIIYPEGYGNELQPLIDQKKTRGFKVVEMTTSQTGNTCAGIRSAINTWAASVPLGHDLYCLLVGDTDEIPLCTAPTGVPTDDLYASTSGDDLDEEVFLGRLSVDSESDCANQVAKILAYEDAPNSMCCYDQVALWAHKENAPGKYVGAHESVRTATYAFPPNFTTYYGHQTGVDDADILADINNAIGLVAYRGHGSSSSTATGWNLSSEYWNSSDVAGITIGMNQTPVVWSFACTNMALNTSDCIAEIWMEQVNTGSVSYYGATVPSYTTQNHELDRQMFKAVYDLGLITQSHAIQYAEDQMASLVGSANAWMYLLLGDPDMQIRRRNDILMVAEYPLELSLCEGKCPVEFYVRDRAGQPVQGALVGLWMPPAPGSGQDRVYVNRYTEKDGRAVFQLPIHQPGDLHVSIEGKGGIIAVDKIPVGAFD